LEAIQPLWGITSMNKHYKLAARLISKSVLVTALTLSSLTSIAKADPINKPYDWLINVQTQQFPRAFTYRNSQIQGVIKATVNYQQDSDPNKQTEYEYLWFHDSKTLGVEKLHTFDVTKGDGVAISVTHKTTPTPEELKASGNAVVHLVLDSVVNKNVVALITVPYGSFDGIVAQMQAQNFQVLSNAQVELGANPVGINVFVASNPPGLMSQLIHY